MDEHYCFFDEKGVNWDEVHTKYQKQLNAGMSDAHLFEVCANMLSELKDGHVNIFSSFDMARNWSWHEDYPENYDELLINNYLGTDYKIASSLRYKILDDNVGYLQYSSFQSDFGAGNIDQVLLEFAPCQALIIDIRNNSGGLLSVAEKLAARFTNEEILVGYMRHKTGKGHNDFSAMEEQRLKPSNGVRWHKPVFVLTNRQVYSAANEFVKYMKCCGAIIVGDHTGGGAGMPFSSELPNGWGVRFSACPMYDIHKQSTEGGIAPDYSVALKSEDAVRGLDTIIEFARNIVASH
jgi:C-terminal processing protease CtpA/Prc